MLKLIDTLHNRIHGDTISDQDELLFQFCQLLKIIHCLQLLFPWKFRVALAQWGLGSDQYFKRFYQASDQTILNL